MRGEYIYVGFWGCLKWELPPRARRIPHSTWFYRRNHGTTSACAENTRAYAIKAGPARNYLRVRGEYFNIIDDTEAGKELPPRARRILKKQLETYAYQGTTSACAENTLICFTALMRCRNYLRVRGEYYNLDQQRVIDMELPPRARRILSSRFCVFTIFGTTSACAENTVQSPHRCVI